MGRHRRKEEMYPLIEAYLAGEESERTFCEVHGLTRSTFAYWRAKYRRDQQTGFIEVRPEVAPTEKAHVEVLYRSGTRVRLFTPVTPSYVMGLVEER